MKTEGEIFEVETKSLRTTFIIHSKKKVKSQRIPKKIRKNLESKIHWTIIALLYEITQDYDETEKHLNILKERLLKCIETLEVPVEELNYLTSVRNVLIEEEKTYILMEEYFNYLEEEIDKTCLNLCTLDENMQKVQKEIEALKRELRTLDSEADKIFNRDIKPVLRLPDFLMEYFKRPPLQNEVLKIGNPHALLSEMNIIRQSKEMKNMMAFLEELYEKAETRCNRAMK